MTRFSWEFPYTSQRMPVLAANVVATSQPLAAQAGLRMLLKGGNAVDAALATAIALTVVEPTMNGIGSDAFALVWDRTQLNGLNASGRAPAAWSPARFANHKTMPLAGWASEMAGNNSHMLATASIVNAKLSFMSLQQNKWPVEAQGSRLANCS